MSSLQHKMKNYEVTPPAQAWERIAAALDEETTGDFATRLYHLEVAPPAAAWNNIAATLPEQTPVVPMRKRGPAFLRYAVAAAFISVAALGIVRWLSKGPEQTGVAKAGIPASPAAGIDHPGSSNTATNNESRITDTDPEKTAITQPLAESRSRRAIRTVAAGNESATTGNRVYAYEDHLPDMAGRYITLMTPNGNFIRMSKKWEGLVCCVSGEEQDDDCKTQLRQWQEKIARSPQATSPGNFLDILSLVSALDDNADL